MTKKLSTYVVTSEHVVHFRWCEAGNSYSGHDMTTAVEMLAMIRRGDSQRQFGGNNSGPSILTACVDCVTVEALNEATANA